MPATCPATVRKPRITVSALGALGGALQEPEPPLPLPHSPWRRHPRLHHPRRARHSRAHGEQKPERHRLSPPRPSPLSRSSALSPRRAPTPRRRRPHAVAATRLALALDHDAAKHHRASPAGARGRDVDHAGATGSRARRPRPTLLYRHSRRQRRAAATPSCTRRRPQPRRPSAMTTTVSCRPRTGTARHVELLCTTSPSHRKRSLDAVLVVPPRACCPSATSSPWSAPSPAIPDALVCLYVEPRHQANCGSELAAVTNPTLSTMTTCPDDAHGPRYYA
ncbi:serine/arginine repetitive matrix protein 1-like [Sorghum bicolor]|uniref:serine/arginine repetitive matrix protein 1-like n=1 Tax=Sorghum bicolor TaxID=4558 RepID=UPI000B4260A5|nr:serine/arginine repetitive matrix protein 1-like [Sorghum bicolor]|eukprot:XP_021315158.1 serine/arginine repetitive matrix protein 1-like [Sorghum bicolor]